MKKVLYKFHFLYYEFFLTIILGIILFSCSLYFFVTPLSNEQQTVPTMLFLKYTSIISVVLIGLAFIWAIYYVFEYHSLKKIISEDKYQVVIGEIKNYTKKGINSKFEKFEIDDVKFRSLDIFLKNGYYLCKKFSGIIKGNGQKLKIYYVQRFKKNIIVYIEEI